MKALFELEFRQGIYGDKFDEDISGSEYIEMQNLVDSTFEDAVNRVAFEIYEDYGLNDLDLEIITVEDTNRFSYVVSTGFPDGTASVAFDIIMKEMRILMQQYTPFKNDFGLTILAWKKFTDGTEPDCPHQYKTVQFVVVGSEIREVQTCEHCKESIAKEVKLV